MSPNFLYKQKFIPLKFLPSHHLFNRAGKARLVTNGCFDVLHPGHVQMFGEMKRHLPANGIVIVGINSDAAVHKLKGDGRPVFTAEDRVRTLCALHYVDIVTIFDDTCAADFLKLARPHVYFKGGDYTPETLDSREVAVLHQNGSEIKILPEKHQIHTSDLIQPA